MIFNSWLVYDLFLDETDIFRIVTSFNIAITKTPKDIAKVNKSQNSIKSYENFFSRLTTIHHTNYRGEDHKRVKILNRYIFLLIKASLCYNNAILLYKNGNFREALLAITENINFAQELKVYDEKVSELTLDGGKNKYPYSMIMASSYNLKGITERRLKRPNKSLKSFNQALSFDKKNSFITINRAVLYLTQGRYQLAHNDSLSIFEKLRNEPAALNCLGYCESELAKSEASYSHEKALVYYRQALKLLPNDTLIRGNRVICYMNKGDYAKAEKDLKKIRQLQSKKKVRRDDGDDYNLAVCYCNLDQCEKSRKLAEKLLLDLEFENKNAKDVDYTPKKINRLHKLLDAVKHREESGDKSEVKRIEIKSLTA